MTSEQLQSVLSMALCHNDQQYSFNDQHGADDHAAAVDAIEAAREYCTETGPAFLEACKSALELIEETCVAEVHAVKSAANILKAAIAKAEGN